MTDQPVEVSEYESLSLLDYGTEPDLVAAVAHGRSILP